MKLEDFAKLDGFERIRRTMNPLHSGLDQRIFRAEACVPYNPYGDFNDIVKRSESFLPLATFGDLRAIMLCMHLDPDYTWMMHKHADMRIVTLFMTFMRHDHDFFPIRDYYMQFFTRLHIGRNMERVCVRHKWPLRVEPTDNSMKEMKSVARMTPGFAKSKWDRTNKVQLVLAQNHKAAALEMICSVAWDGSNRDVLGIISGYMDDAVGSTVGADMLPPETIYDPRWQRLCSLVERNQSNDACHACKVQSGLDFERAIGMDPDVIHAFNVEPRSYRAIHAMKAVHLADHRLVEAELTRTDSNNGMRGVPETTPYFFLPLHTDDWKVFRKPDPLAVDDTNRLTTSSQWGDAAWINNERKQRHRELTRIYEQQRNATCTCPIGVCIHDEIVGICNALKLCVWALCL